MDLPGLIADIARLPIGTRGEQGLVGLVQGVAYSLHRAADLGFAPPVSPAFASVYGAELETVGKALQAGNEPASSWLAGFFFNSAVIRIAAGSHRAMRLLFQVDSGGFHDLASRAVREGRLRDADIALLRDCYRDVNDFKHDADALLLSTRRIATLEQAADAAWQLVRVVRLAV